MVLYRWKSWFSGIHEAAVFTENVDQAPLTVTERNQWKAEARALRAIYYFYLVRTYGPVPLLEKDFPMDTPSDELQLPRNTVDECFDFIVSELKGAQNDGLLDDASTDKVSGYGRIDKAIAQAFIIEALTYRASWLFNGECTYYADMANPDGTRLFPSQPDAATIKADWQKVVTECQKFFADYGNRFQLMYTDKSGKSVAGPDAEGFNPYESYRRAIRTLFSEMGNNKEMIFYRMDNAAGTMQYDRMPNKSGNTNDYRGGSLLGATQEMVDAYFMANGMSPVTGYAADGVTPIINEASGYKEDGTSSSDYKSADGTLYAPAGTRNMYVNREPRFYASVAFNGAFWALASAQDGDRRNQQVWYYRGSDNGRKNSSDYWIPTGIGVMKFVSPNDCNTNNGRIYDKVDIALRYPYMVMMYAEALKELTPSSSYEVTTWEGEPITVSRNTEEIRKAVLPVRMRAGVPDYNEETYNDQTLFRKKLIHERQVEFMGENQRYYDLRRWKLAPVEESEQIYGYNVLMTESKKERFYERIRVENLQANFSRKMYFWPMPQNELKRNRKMTQAPGWETFD